MLLAVAGLNQQRIDQRTESMASGDWSQFSTAEQTAFAFARKQSVSPADITQADVLQLIAQFGTERALDAIWWSSRCHFMTRVADAFQLPLEQENVFEERAKDKSANQESDSPRIQLPDNETSEE
ncbi:MAG: hypothetical protein R3C19_17375 [Planctomycetaceae bacterium]